MKKMNADQFERDIAPVLAHDAIRAESSIHLRDALNATLKLKDINKRLPDVLTEEDTELIQKFQKEEKLLKDFVDIEAGFEKQFKKLETTLDKTDPDSLKLQETMRNLVSQVTPKLEMQMELFVDLTSKNETYKVELEQLNAQLIELRTGTNMTDAMKDLLDSHYKAKEKLTEGRVDLKTTSDLYKKIGALESRKDNLKRDLSITNTNLLSMTKERDELRSSKANHEQIERESKAIQASKLNLEQEKVIASGLAARLSEEENKSKGLQKDIDDLRNRPVLAADMHAGRSKFLEKIELEGANTKLTTMVPRSDLDTLQAQFDTLKTEANKDRTSLASVVTQEDHEAILKRVRTVYENASKDFVPKADLESTQKRFNAASAELDALKLRFNSSNDTTPESRSFQSQVPMGSISRDRSINSDRAQSQPQVHSQNGFQASTSTPVTPSSTRHYTGMDLSQSRPGSTFIGLNSRVPLPGPNSISETRGHGVNLGIGNGQQLSIPPQNKDIPLASIEQSPQPSESPMPPRTDRLSRAQTPSHIPLPAFDRQYGDSMLPQPGYSSRAQTPSLPPPTFGQQFGNPMTPRIGHSSRAQTPSHIPIPVQAGGMMPTSRQASIRPHNRCMFLISGTVNQGPRTLQVLPELIDKIQIEMQDWDSHPSNTKKKKKQLSLSVAPSSAESPDRFACPYCVENRKLCVLVSLSGPVIAPLPINYRSVDANPTTRGYYIRGG
ncbi:hypothetical protein BCON_0261g00010 [Botryotinia convoluta]|uniref:Uncharacterized protein n=1 Tax=Botryotinia convoluta TaxID=54673 RepID=A0A4Z1HFZ1_9HELO|nr:hypothetical protein BCON_0261g00010 [Botryotinia convoluta]